MAFGAFSVSIAFFGILNLSVWSLVPRLWSLVSGLEWTNRGPETRNQRPPGVSSSDASHFQHAAHLAERAHDAIELVNAVDDDLEGVGGATVDGATDLRPADVDAGRADRLTHRGQHAGLVHADDNVDGDGARRGVALLP